jgi:PAS domain S-box-containing protein
MADFQGVEQILRDSRYGAAQAEWRLIKITCLILVLALGAVVAFLTRAQTRALAKSFQQSLDVSQSRAEELTRSQERLRQVNRTLIAHIHSNQMLLHAESEAVLLEQICRIIVEDCGYAMAWIGMAVDDERKTVRPVAHAGAEDGYLEAADITWADEERGRGPTGMAIRTGQPQSCRNMATDPKIGPWREPARQRGYAASLVLPLILAGADGTAASAGGPELPAGKVFGALTVYSRVVDPFSPDEVQLLSELAADVAYGIGVLRSRTARARAEAALQEERQLLKITIESLAERLYVCDCEGRPLLTNEAFRKYYPHAAAPIYPRTFGEAIEVFDSAGRLLPLEEWPIPRALRGETLRNLELRVAFRLTGKELTCSYNATPVRNAEGKVAMAVLTAADVTGLKRSEEALRESQRQNEFLAGLIRSSSQPLGVGYPDGRLGLVNRAFEELTGYSAAELQAMDWSRELTPPEWRALEHESLAELERTGEPVRYEKEYVRKNGSRVPIELLVHRVAGADGKTLYYYSFLTDITERKQAQRQLAANLDAMTRLQKLGTLFVRGGELEPILGQVVEAAIAISGADFGDVQLLDAETGGLRIVAQRGFPQWWVDYWSLVAKGQGSCGAALQQGRRVVIEDVEKSPVFAGQPALDVQLRAGARAVQSTPLVSRSGRPLGMFSTHYKRPHRPDENALRLLDLLARQAADIIARAQDQEALRTSEAKYRNLFQNMAEEVHFWKLVRDEAGHIKTWRLVDANPPALRTWDRGTIAEIQGKTADEIFPGVTAHYMWVVQKIMTEGVPHSYEDYLPNLRRHFRFTSVPLGEYFITTGADITAIKEAQKALQESEAHLRQSEERWATTLQSIGDAVISTDAAGRIVFMNEVAQRLTGWPLSEARGKDLNEVFAVVQEVTRIRPENPVAKVLRMGKVVGLGNHTLLIRRDGSEIPIEDSGAPIRDREGRVRGAVLIFHDVSEQRKLERALRESERLATTGRLAATLAHEIHNPLDVVGNLLYLAGKAAREEQTRQYLEMANQEVERIAQMTQHLLTFQRESAEPAKVQIGEILEHVLGLYRKKIEAASIRLTQEIDFCDGIFAQPGELRQVFANLVGNALEAVEAGRGCIRVRARASRDWRTGRPGLRVLVADNGPGIPPALREKIFEPFFTTKCESGTGLGLWVTTGIVGKYQGMLRLRSSTRPGRSGACFSVFFPAESNIAAHEGQMANRLGQGRG